MVRLMVDSGAPQADLNITDKKGWTAFMAACEGGNVDCVEYLWKHGAEHKMQDKNRWTALEEARSKGFKQVMQLFTHRYVCSLDPPAPQETLTHPGSSRVPSSSRRNPLL